MARWSRIAPYIPFAIVLVGVLAYRNTFTNPFIFDDARIITGNPGIDRLFPICFSTRWLVDFTFRLNYRLAGFNVPDYHAFNLGVHLATALLLFGVIRRTLALPRLCERWAAPAVWIAGEAAAIRKIRTHVFDDRGLPRTAATIRGYWKQGRSAT